MDAGARKDKKSKGGFDYTVPGHYLDQYECRGDDRRIARRNYIYDLSKPLTTVNGIQTTCLRVRDIAVK